MPKNCSKVAQKVCKVARVTYRDCTKKKQPEAEMSLVYDVAHPGYQRRARAERVTREKEME